MRMPRFEPVLHGTGSLILLAAFLALPADGRGEALRSPNSLATALTNLALAAQCAVLATMLSRAWPTDEPEARSWRAFYLFLGWAALLGAAKHGWQGHLDPAAHTMVRGGSDVLVGGAILAVHSALLPQRRRSRFVIAVAFASVATVSAAVGSFGPTGGAAAATMVPVLVATSASVLRGAPGGRTLALAWTSAAVAGLAWIALPAPASWFSSIDVAHVTLIAVLWLIFRGAGARLDARHRPAAPSGREPAGSGRGGHRNW